MLPTRCIYR